MTVPKDALRRWTDGEPVTLDELGGAESVLQVAEELLRDDPLAVVEIICSHWAEFRTEPKAVELLQAAAATDDIVADDIHDVILTNSDVLPDFAAALAATLRPAALREGILGDIATESWTRLALGGWCPSLDLRAHLMQAAAKAHEASDTTIYLVRATGAALNQWADQELETGFAALGSLDEFEADVAFDFGIYHLGLACRALTTDAALTELGMAAEHLRRAERWDRVDAKAFLAPIDGLLRFVGGQDVSVDEAAEARRSVNTYLLGYRGLNPHWRQGRGDTSDGWATLLGLLSEAAEAAESEWLEPSAIIEAAGALYLAESSLRLVVRTATDAQQAVSALIRPQLVETFVQHRQSVLFFDRWLTRAHRGPAPDTALIGAVEQLREKVQHSLDVLPKDESGLSSDRETARTVEQQVAHVLALHDEIKRGLTLTESDVVRRIIEDIRVVVPNESADVITELMSLTISLVRFTATHLNRRQTGERKIPWLGIQKDSGGLFPKEHVLSDALKEWLDADGLRAQIELVNVGGGDADLAVQFSRATLYIEVKRVTTERDNEQVVSQFGDQAVQYAATDVPIVFLALLDYAHRTVRIDLEGVMWTVPHQPDSSSRTYALTGMRVQAHADSPSVSSRKVGRRT